MKNGQAQPWRPLLALTVAVLAAHVLLLQTGPRAVQPREAIRPIPFITRSVDLRPAAVETVPAQTPRHQPPRVAPGRPAVARAFTAPAHKSASDAPPGELQAAALTASAGNSDAAGTALTLTAGESVPAKARQSAAQARSFAIPGSMLLHYRVNAQVRGVDLRASGELDWRHEGGSYVAQLRVHALFLPTRTQRSTGQITADGLAPTRFSDKTRSEEATHFERDKGKLVFSNNRPDAPLLAGAQDRLSVLLQLGAMIAGEPAKYPPGTAIGIQTASTRDAEIWLFTIEGEEEQALPGGRLRTVRLIRNPRQEFDQKVELWLAPDLDYMPVRLRLTQQNGDFVDQQWASTEKG